MIEILTISKIMAKDIIVIFLTFLLFSSNHKSNIIIEKQVKTKIKFDVAIIVEIILGCQLKITPRVESVYSIIPVINPSPIKNGRSVK